MQPRQLCKLLCSSRRCTALGLNKCITSRHWAGAHLGGWWECAVRLLFTRPSELVPGSLPSSSPCAGSCLTLRPRLAASTAWCAEPA